MKSVLISTLGDPSAWDPVEYIYDKFSFRSISTLPLSNYITPKQDTIILVVLDTIIDEKTSSYDDLVEKVRSKYTDLISKKVGLSCDRVKIIVAPGIGRFRPKDKDLLFNFIGSLSDFYAYITFEISKLLAESEMEVTIHLDLTHGINFMPALTLLAIKKISSTLALTRNSVRLKVYNAEPYRKGITERLNIHLVEDSPAVIEYDLMPLGAKGKCVLLKGNVISREEDLRTLTVNCNKMRRKLNAFLSSVFNGLPLALYTFYPDIAELENIIEKTVEIWRENINVALNGNEVYVKRNLSFGEDFIKLTQIWLIAKTLNLSRKTEVSYKELNSLRENFFSKFSEKIDSMISRDLYRVKRDVEEKREKCRDWVKLRTIYEESKDFTERDFLAHSGLEMNVTEAKYDEQSIMLRYAEDEMKNVIKGCLHGLLKVKQVATPGRLESHKEN
ncbi:MAG: CRISPR-associated CARF protein Csx1 [Candidatus Korarchaeota archaeon]